MIRRAQGCGKARGFSGPFSFLGLRAGGAFTGATIAAILFLTSAACGFDLIRAAAAAAQPAKPVVLAYGPNSIDINGDGRPDLVLKAWRESFNGSGFQTYQFLVNMGPERRTFLDERQRERDSAAPARSGDLWEVVPIEDPDGKRMQLVLAEAETGPCNLRTAALVHQPGVGIVLIVAEKRATADILGSSAVAIDFYTVAHNPDGVPGEPTYSFRRSESVATKKPYCDAREALDAILAGRD